MKVTVWGINYAPEQVGIGPFNTVLCDYLVERGHEVLALTTFPYYPGWRKQPEDKGRWFRQDRIGRVTVQRCWHYVPAKVNAWRRILHEFSFVFFSALRFLFLPRPDLIFVVSPPLLLGLAAWWMGFLKRAPFVFHVQDLQPDAAVGLGLIRPGLLMRLLYGLEKIAYRQARFVSGISPAMLEAFRAKGLPENRIVYFPNGVRLKKPEDFPPRGLFREKFALASDDFLAIYSGNMGLKQGLGQLLDAARELTDSRCKIVLVGAGAGRAALERRLRENPQMNVFLLPIQPEELYEAMLRDADVCLVTQEAGTGQFFLPSKLLRILALGRPVLAAADETSALAAALREGNFGQCVPANQPRILAEVLQRMMQSGEGRESWGQAGRRYVAKFSFDQVLPAYAQALESAVRPGNQ